MAKSHSKEFRKSRPAEPEKAQRITDPRFQSIQNDPLYRLPSKKDTHVQVDARFKSMLRDDRFQSKAKVDRYGRKLNVQKNNRDLKRIYDFGDEDKADSESEDESDDAADDDDEVRAELARVSGRKEIESESESSSEEESDEEDLEDEEEAEIALDAGDVAEGEVTSRLAIVNLDWDHIRAIDLMTVLSSFAPKSGRVLSVAIYPSEFGKERMEKEEIEGPPKDIFARSKDKRDIGRPDPRHVREAGNSEEDGSEEDEDEDELDPSKAHEGRSTKKNDVEEEDDEDGSAAEVSDDEFADLDELRNAVVQEDKGEEFDVNALRRYQLERLRYFYAVVNCSSPACAEQIYKSVDGTEYLSTANFFDLRFIPDETDFSMDRPREKCDKLIENYKPNDFVTDALQHSKVKLTWDADDTTRKEAQKRAFSGSRAAIDENDLKAYLGTDSSDNEEDEDESKAPDDEDVEIADHTNGTGEVKVLSKKEQERQKMRALLGLSDEPRPSKAERGPVGDMEITFTSGLGGKKDGNGVFENEPPQRDETTAEKYIRKEKERKARRKAKSKAGREDGAEAMDQAEEQDDAEEPKEDTGFDDPFFTAPAEHAKAQTQMKKKAKELKRAEKDRAREEAQSQAAELQQLMDDGTNDASNGKLQHFDMDEVIKAEKAQRRKKLGGRKVKLSQSDKDALKAKEHDDFKINVSDPRFSAVFERPEYAVDPGHPRFQGTEGMKKLLEEGRKKRASRLDEEEERHFKKSKPNGAGDGGKAALDSLVKSVKRKEKSR